MNFRFNDFALASVDFDTVSIHVGVRRDRDWYYKPGREEPVECDWVWGRATEYTGYVEHFGLGPFMLICW